MVSITPNPVRKGDCAIDEGGRIEKYCPKGGVRNMTRRVTCHSELRTNQTLNCYRGDCT